MYKVLFIILFCFSLSPASAQFQTRAQKVITNEDSLSLDQSGSKTVISGYGSAYYQRDFNAQQSVATLERVVLFVGHRFNERISVFTELEVENALVAGMEEKGEVAMEQAFLKFNLNSRQYFVAGLFIPRIGILNENHLPVNFNGVERPLVETYIIPSVWRELGVGFYGSANSLNYSAAILNGLNSESFEHGTGIRDGRAEGSMASANNLALTASLQYQVSNLKLQVSGYMGGTVGLNHNAADSLALSSGAFGTPVYLGEANAQYNAGALSAKIIGAYIAYPEANKVNAAYAKNLASSMYGAYAELAYDLLYSRKKQAQLMVFARYEAIDLNAGIPDSPEGIYDGTLKQTHLIAGLNYMPIPNVAIKADVRLMNTGEQNPALIINPAPNALPYQQNNTLLNIGIGYSF